MIGLNGEESAEAPYSLGMQPFSFVGPVEGRGIKLIPGFDKLRDFFLEDVKRGEVVIIQALPLEDTKPDFHDVEPG